MAPNGKMDGDLKLMSPVCMITRDELGPTVKTSELYLAVKSLSKKKWFGFQVRVA